MPDPLKPRAGRKSPTATTSGVSPKARATLKDVAELAGVDKSTISRALRGDASLNIRAETRERIEAAVRTLNYQPNMAGRSLRTQRSFSLGIIVPSLENPVYAQIILGAEKGASERGYTLLIIHREPKDGDVELYDRFVQQHRVDGLLVTSLRSASIQLPALNRLSVPYILVNRRARGARNWMVVDDFEGARIATGHLISKGHRDIAHISGDLERYNSIERLNGYKAALEAAGIPFRPELVSEADYTQAGGERAMEDLLRRVPKRFSAVFAVTLLTAAGALSVLHRRGIPVPDEKSLISFHDGAIADLVFPPLTSVRVPLEDMGQAAALSLIDLIEGGRKQVRRTFEGADIVARGTVRTGPFET